MTTTDTTAAAGTTSEQIRDAIDDFLGSAFAARWYGESFRHIYSQQKLREMRDFHALVPDLDYAWYLRTV